MFACEGPIRALPVVMVAVLCCVVLAPGCKSASPPPPKVANPIEDEFTAAKDRQPTSRTLYAMSRLLAARGQTEQARYVLQRVIDEEPSFVAAYSDLADLQLRDGMPDAATTTLEKALELSPDDPILQNNLGMCWLTRGEYEKAVEHFGAAVVAAPRNVRFVSNKATALALQGKYDEALETYKLVLPEADAHHNLAVVLESRGMTESAAKHYQLAEKRK